MPKRLIRIAHSPDTDDIFMFYALCTKLITHPDYEFEISAHNIDKLNHVAHEEIYDITAVSIHAFAHLQDKYALLSSGASMAEKNYGPMLVAKHEYELKDLQNKKIAVPGETTTAFLLLKMALPDFHYVVMPPEKILDAIANNEITAGLLIHEGQIQFNNYGFKVIHRVLNTWRSLAGYLPLPLGGSAVKKSLGEKVMKDLSELQKKSIRYGLEHHVEAREYCLKLNPVLSEVDADRYLSWYVNDRTLDFGEDGRKALKVLFDAAFKQRLIPNPVSVDLI